MVQAAEVTAAASGTNTELTVQGQLNGMETRKIKHALATAVNDFLVASGAGAFVKKTLAETKTILGLAFGTTAGTYCQGNDTRLSDARTPALHKASHTTGGTDALTAANVGAPALVAATTDNAIVRFNGTAGLQQNSLATVSDAGTLNIPAGQKFTVGGVDIAYTPPAGITIIQDQRPSGTSGGNVTAAGVWATRVLNTYQINQIGLAALSSNRFTLPAGTYEILAHVPGRRCTSFKAKLFNVTSAADALIGTSITVPNGSDNGTAHSIISGIITLAAPATFEIQHYSTGTDSGSGGYGSAVSIAGTIEVYTTISIRAL